MKSASKELINQMLKNQSTEITRLRNDIRELHKKIDTRVESTSKKISEKTPSKLFYLFISIFTIIYISGMVATYKKANENTLIFQNGLTSLRVTQTELKERLTYTADKTDKVEIGIDKLQDKLEEAIRDIRKQIREGN